MKTIFISSYRQITLILNCNLHSTDKDRKFVLNPSTFVQYSEKQTANLIASMLAEE